MNDFEHVTTEEFVAVYLSATSVFTALLHEVRELSKKKPDATMSASKVKLVNAVLDDLLKILKDDPEGKYLQRLENDDLPQVSDALMMMAQFNAALDAFPKRYRKYIMVEHKRELHWITVEKLAQWEAEDDEIATDNSGI